MKLFISFAKWITILCIIGIAAIYLFDINYLVKAVRVTYFTGHKTAFLEDYHYFSNREIKSGTAIEWPKAKTYNKVTPTQKLERTHKELQTTSFLIIKNDSIWHESYYDIGSQTSKTNSFSMAKSIVTTALGIAIDQQIIPSLDAKVIDYLPELKGTFANEVTIGDLASMASGQKWREDYYGPFSITTQAYFRTNLRDFMLDLPIESQPGLQFNYQSGDTQLLAMVLEKATKTTLADFVSKNLWQPLGMEQSALWQTDQEDNGIEKAYCCIASNARDFSKIGLLYLHKGNWKGNQILSESFVDISTKPRFENSTQYGYGFWLTNYRQKKIYYMRGHLGQFVIVIPEDQLIITRLGHLKGLQTETDPHSEDLYVYIDETYEMLKAK